MDSVDARLIEPTAKPNASLDELYNFNSPIEYKVFTSSHTKVPIEVAIHASLYASGASHAFYGVMHNGLVLM